MFTLNVALHWAPILLFHTNPAISCRIRITICWAKIPCTIPSPYIPTYPHISLSSPQIYPDLVARSQRTAKKSQPLHCPRSRDWLVQAVLKASQWLSSNKESGLVENISGKPIWSRRPGKRPFEIEKDHLRYLNNLKHLPLGSFFFEKEAATHQPRFRSLRSVISRISQENWVRGIPWVDSDNPIAAKAHKFKARCLDL